MKSFFIQKLTICLIASMAFGTSFAQYDVPANYTTISDAIAAAPAGSTINVAPGSYTEVLTINKPLTINGANLGIAGTGSRGPETVLSDCNIDITYGGLGNVTLDGFKIFQTDGNANVVLISGGTTALIQNNIFERNGVVANQGVRGIETSSGSGVKTIQNNLFTGDLSGGVFSGHKTWNNAIYLNAGGSTVNILGNTIRNTRSAVNLDDYNNGITLSNNTFENCGTYLSFGGVVATNGQFILGANEFKTAVPGRTIINLSNVNPAFRLDMTSSTYNGVSFSSLSVATLFQVELAMIHRGRINSSIVRNGLVYYVPNNIYILSTAGINNNIQTAVGYAASGDIINLESGFFNQKVTIPKSLTLQGSTANKSDHVLDGTALGNASGILINNNIKNVTIKNLTVQNFSGSGGNNHAGIYGNLSNDNLTIDNVALLNNPNASGFYANGPVDMVSITNSLVANNGGGARGIVIWNGLKKNINFSNNIVMNNSCCGIELSDGNASAVTVSNNTIDIGSGDNAIGLVGLNSSIGANDVSNNVITGGGRFGIEIKNPSGGVSVTGNSVTMNSLNGDLRDRAGIAVFRRGVLTGNADVPNGVTITGNTVTGYTQTLPEEGFGIVIEGTNHVVTGNTVNNSSVGIQEQGGGHAVSNYPGDGDQAVGQSPSYFGRGNAPIACGNTISGNSFSGNGINTRSVTANSYGLVTNTNTGEYFCSIQAAIDDPQTMNTHTLTVGSGTYNEDINVTKQLSIIGSGYSSTTIVGQIGGDNATVRISSEGSILEGFTITRDGNSVAQWNNPNLNTAGVAVQGQLANAEIRNNRFDGNRTAIDINNSNDNNIHNNIIENNRTGIFFRNQTDNTNVQNNFVRNNWTVGVLFIDGSGGTNVPVQSAVNSNFNNNDISGNWYGQVVDRQIGVSLPSPGTNIKNFECNWWGTTVPIVTTANSTEPGYSAQIPVAYGGTATSPGGQPDIAGPASANIDYQPLLTTGNDSSPVMGFQPAPGSCNGLLVICDSKPKDTKYVMCHKGKTHCVKEKDIQKKLEEGWTLGPCTQENCDPDETLMCKNGDTECVKNKDIAKKEKQGWVVCGVAPRGSESVEVSIVDQFTLKALPNPANSSTTIRYELPLDSKVNIVLYDPMGRVVGTLVDASRVAGVYNYELNTSKLPAGIYYYKMTAVSGAEKFVQSQKLMIVK